MLFNKKLNFLFFFFFEIAIKMTGLNDDWTKLKDKLRDDPKGKYILSDPTMVTWGKNSLKKVGYGQERYIRDRMRTVATFCLKYIENEGSDDYFIKDILQTKNFGKICSVAQVAFNESLTPATKLDFFFKRNRSYITKCCNCGE